MLDTEHAGGMVIRGSVLRLAGFGAGLLMSVGSAAILLRHLGVEDTGRYNTVISLVAIVGGLTDAGMGNIGVREYAALSGDERSRMMRDLLGLRIALTLVGVLVGIVFGLGVGYSNAMVIGTGLAGLGLVLQIIAATMAVPLSVGLRLGTVSALDVVRNAANALGITILVLSGAGLLGFLAVPLPASAVLVAVTAPLIARSISLRPSVHVAAWRALIADALPYAAATAVGIVYIYLTVIALGFVADEKQVGLFSAAFRVFIVIAGISALVVQSAFPVLTRAARDDRRRLGYAVQRLFEGNVVVGAFVGLCTAVGAPLAILIIAGRDFAGSVPVLRVQGAALLMTFVAGVGSYSLLALRRHGALLAINALALTVSLTLTLALGATDGARGAAVANLAGEAMLALGGLLALGRQPEGVRVHTSVIWRTGLAVAAGVGAAVLAPGPTILETAAAAAAYTVVAIAVGAVPVEIRQAFLRHRH
ncbi:MAG: oligosaccharide flippase family protein [Actinomycetota bacterium]|nr:oligosaccharide flippase family protein [Actinomycetota bacterium]